MCLNMHMVFHVCVSISVYIEQLSFSLSQLLFVDGEELVETPAVTMDTILEFVNLPFHPYQNILQSVDTPTHTNTAIEFFTLYIHVQDNDCS